MPTVDSGVLGQFIRAQRQRAQLSLREMARMADISNAYLSQVERGLHEPSLRVLHALADALEVPVEQLVTGGVRRSRAHTCSVADAILDDPHLDQTQRDALLAVYRSFVAGRAGPRPRSV